MISKRNSSYTAPSRDSRDGAVLHFPGEEPAGRRRGAVAARRRDCAGIIGTSGFTIIEMVITASIMAIISVIVLGPMVYGLRFSQREASVLAMDRSADLALNAISDTLRSALVPVTTYEAKKVPVKTEEIVGFQDLLNSTLGFGANGVDWHAALAEGTDFVPFTVPVDFGDDGDTLDSNLVPELGVILPGGIELAAGAYIVDTDENTNVLDASVAGCLHPSLAALRPGYFGDDIPYTAGEEFDPDQPRYAHEFVFPDGHFGYGLIRFVPYRQGNPENDEFIFVEEHSGALNFDINEDGSKSDTYILGSLEIAYAIDDAGTILSRKLTGPTVLLQTNRESPAWTPLFQLVRYRSGDDDTPNSSNFSGEAVDTGGYALLIRFLMYDRLSQSGNLLAFRKGLPVLVRQYQTLIKLRNLSNDTRIGG